MTIKDIAKMAGVSVATVSHVINKTRFVSDDLADKVRKAIEEVDYHPNAMAGSLRRKKTKTVGLIVPDSSNPLYAELAKAIENILFSHETSLMLCNSEHMLEREKHYIRALRAKMVDGLILIPATAHATHLNRLTKSGMPVVVLDRPLSNLECDAVLIDHFQGAYDATAYLIELGYERIAYIDKIYDLPHKQERWKGFLKALADHGIRLDERLHVECGVSLADGKTAMDTLLKVDPLPAGVLCFDDVIALGALRSIQDCGMKVPEDISVVGFDDMPLCSFTFPRLTTVYYPKFEMADLACKILFKRIESQESGRKLKIILPLRLVIRESTRA